jgi:FMN phosphatase YigB (HAD superfamily)
VTLTNSPPAAVEQQLRAAELAEFFERSFSIDAVRRFKPAPEPYRFVATELGVETSALRMVAAYAWDVVGAMQAGCAAAFVARPGKVLYPLGPKRTSTRPTFARSPTGSSHSMARVDSHSEVTEIARRNLVPTAGRDHPQ